MSCNKCKEDKCFEIESPDCDDGCSQIIPTNCIHHNVDGNSSSKLFNLKIVKGASLNYILKAIDEQLSLLLSADYSSFNLQDELADITNNKEFVEYISLRLKNLEDKHLEIVEDVEEINATLSEIMLSLDEIINISVSSSKLNINTSDDLQLVLNKLIQFIEDISIPTPLQFEDSSTVDFSTMGNKISADVILSEQAGNTLRKLDDGLYSSNPSVSSLLNTINTNPELKNLFNSLVLYPSFKFDIMSDSNRNITYINQIGVEVVATAKKDVLLQLTDVREIITIPVAGLNITFKGI